MAANEQIIKKDSLPTEVIDTLGAGDAFTAAFLGVLAGENSSYQKALTEGLKSAAKYCRIKGALGVYEKRDQPPKIYNNFHG